MIDTHTHAVSPDRSRFPLGPTGVGSQWWSEAGHDAESMLAVAGANQVERVMLVQPVGVYGYDNAYVVDAAARHPGRLAAVPAVDLEDPRFSGAIARLGEHPQVAGIRLFAVVPGSTWPSDTERAAAGLDAVRRAGLAAVLTVFDHQLAELTPLIIRHGGAIALDHCGFPRLLSGRLPKDAPLLALRDARHVALKVSTHLLHEAATDGDPARLVDQLAEEFGADRLIWGSDYPQTGTDYRAMLSTAEGATRSLTAEERRGFFGDSAARVFARPGLW